MTELLDMIKCCKSCWLLNTLSSGVAIHFGGSMYLFMVFSLSKLKLCCCSTTFQIMNSLKQYVHILKGTTVISPMQPEPQTSIFLMTLFYSLTTSLCIRVPANT
ncbi:ABC transporter G family member 36 [Glycine max]|nr:ABC transporter G family member 36 [Glycine max]